MKFSRLAFILVCAVVVFASDSPDTREITDPKTIASLPALGAAPIPVDDLFYTRSIGGGSWSPDGKEVVFTTNLTGRNNIWKVSAAGGWPIQLSQSDDRQTGAAWSPDGKWLVFQSDHGGAEIYDLFAIPSNGGEVVNLTNTPEISETSPEWSPNGKWLAIQYKPKTSPSTDIAVMDWATRAVRNVTNEKTQDHLWNAGLWSPDGKYLYSTRFNAGFTDADVYRIDVATGEKEKLTPHEGDRRTIASSVSPDGRTLAGFRGPARRLLERGGDRRRHQEAHLGDRSEMGGECRGLFSGRQAIHVHGERRRPRGRVSRGQRHAPRKQNQSRARLEQLFWESRAFRALSAHDCSSSIRVPPSPPICGCTTSPSASRASLRFPRSPA